MNATKLNVHRDLLGIDDNNRGLKITRCQFLLSDNVKRDVKLYNSSRPSRIFAKIHDNNSTE